jgi:hypothetical protein
MVEADTRRLAQPPKGVSRGAKAKGQLSALLSAARDNREELEERIAQAKQNRRSAGSKYGTLRNFHAIPSSSTVID